MIKVFKILHEGIGSLKVKVTGAKKVEYPYSCKVKLQSAMHGIYDSEVSGDILQLSKTLQQEVIH